MPDPLFRDRGHKIFVLAGASILQGSEIEISTNTLCSHLLPEDGGD
jgi:hypothetical protein